MDLKILLYIVLAGIIFYSIKTNYDLLKFRSNKKLRNPEELNLNETKKMEMLVKQKRKWSLLGQVLFFIAIFMILNDASIFPFFIMLYAITMICVNKIEKEIVNLLALN